MRAVRIAEHFHNYRRHGAIVVLLILGCFEASEVRVQPGRVPLSPAAVSMRGAEQLSLPLNDRSYVPLDLKGVNYPLGIQGKITN
jgi:hypothetical protein